MFRIAVLPHRPGVVYYHLLLRRETRIPIKINDKLLCYRCILYDEESDEGGCHLEI